MATFGATITAISKRLLDTSNTAVSTSDVADAINSAIRFWKGKRFWFNETSSNVTYLTTDEITLAATPTNSYTLTLPTDFFIDIPKGALTITSNGEKMQLEKTRPEIFDLLGVTGATGRPSTYILRNGAIETKPYPDQQYSGKLYYLKQYTDFATDGTQNDQTSDFLTYAPELVRAEALARLHAELRQDEKMEAVYTNRAKVEYNNLQSMTRAKNNTGTLTIYS